MSAFRYGVETNAFGDSIGDGGFPSSSSSSSSSAAGAAMFGVTNGGGDFDMNRSYNSSTSNPASSSKAVLNALRSLQDKIRRLEGERTQVLDECTQLRHQVKTQEMETEQLRQRESLAAQKALHEARTAYEKALTEKTDTEVRLGKVEERNREEQRVAEELRVKTKSLQDEKHHGLLALKELEAQKAHLQSQITYAQQKEKDLGQTILFETKRHEEDMDVLNSKLRALQGELSAAMLDKGAVETKLLELDQLVGQLLSVNEGLVTRLSGNGQKETSPGRGGRKHPGTATAKKAAPSPAFVPRAASLSTVSFDHSRWMAGGHSGPLVGKAAGGAGGGNVGRALDEAESLQQMHKMYVDLAQNITQASSSSSAGVGRHRPASAPGGRVGGDDGGNDAHHDPSYQQHQQQHQHQPFAFGSALRGANGSSGDGGRQRGDLQGIINSMEEEFNVLNAQYRRLLAAVQAQSPSVDSSQAEELVDIIQRLHSKGEQLRALKTPSPAPVRSTEF